MRRGAIAAGLALLVVSAAAARSPFAGLAGLRFVYRPIGGDSVATIAAALEAGAEHPAQGGSSYADTRWSIRWHWRGAGAGAACRVRSVAMTFAALVTLPRLADRAALDPATGARWDAFAAATARHEAGHVRRARAAIPAVRRAILRASCDDADAAGRAALRPVDAAQAAYDRATRFGAAQGARFP